jgi:hypothetical protein
MSIRTKIMVKLLPAINLISAPLMEETFMVAITPGSYRLHVSIQEDAAKEKDHAHDLHRIISSSLENREFAAETKVAWPELKSGRSVFVSYRDNGYDNQLRSKQYETEVVAEGRLEAQR